MSRIRRDRSGVGGARSRCPPTGRSRGGAARRASRHSGSACDPVLPHLPPDDGAHPRSRSAIVTSPSASSPGTTPATRSPPMLWSRCGPRSPRPTAIWRSRPTVTRKPPRAGGNSGSSSSGRSHCSVEAAAWRHCAAWTTGKRRCKGRAKFRRARSSARPCRNERARSTGDRDQRLGTIANIACPSQRSVAERRLPRREPA